MLPSHKDGVLYLEHCRLIANDERLSYVRQEGALEKYWAIPYAATGCILLGPGTSITHQAAKFLAREGVMIGFVGGGGAPLYFASQNEYRPTEYLQDWCSFWFSPDRRFEVAKHFMRARVDFTLKCYRHLPLDFSVIEHAANVFIDSVECSISNETLLGAEAVFAKRLYAAWANMTQRSFKREPRSNDLANRFLDNGNYLAYGLSASVLWILGIPHALPVLHGQTRRGALVFDLADVIKDACIMPAAFIGAYEGDDESKNRQRCIAALDRFSALSYLFSVMKRGVDVGCRR